MKNKLKKEGQRARVNVQAKVCTNTSETAVLPWWKTVEKWPRLARWPQRKDQSAPKWGAHAHCAQHYSNLKTFGNFNFALIDGKQFILINQPILENQFRLIETLNKSSVSNRQCPNIFVPKETKFWMSFKNETEDNQIPQLMIVHQIQNQIFNWDFWKIFVNELV